MIEEWKNEKIEKRKKRRIDYLRERLQRQKRVLRYENTVVNGNKIRVYIDSWLYANFCEYECIELFYDPVHEKIRYDEDDPKLKNTINGDEIRRTDIYLIKEIIKEVNKWSL